MALEVVNFLIQEIGAAVIPAQTGFQIVYLIDFEGC
jgi:hypothetical protein